VLAGADDLVSLSTCAAGRWPCAAVGRRGR
jgi:hypothetical protein